MEKMDNNIRSGNMLVRRNKKSKSIALIDEIQMELAKLSVRYPSKRVTRQYRDGEDFLQMISKQPYLKCRTISNLKNEISKQRDILKQELVNLDQYMPGHQISLFEIYEEKTEQEKIEMMERQEHLKRQVHWLHKCLGICSNRNYFK